MKAGSFSALSQDKDSYFQIEAPDIEKATAFAIHPTSYYLFYVVGNQIHQLDMTSRRHRVLPITFPDGKLKTELSGEKITMIKFNMFILGDASKPVGIKDMQSCLIVGSENETTRESWEAMYGCCLYRPLWISRLRFIGPMRVLEKWSMLFIGKENKL